MVKKYMVDLSEEEQALLNDLIASGTQRVRKITHARILLKADEGWTDRQIREALNVSLPTIQRVRQRFIEESFEEALCPHPTQRKYKRLLDGVPWPSPRAGRRLICWPWPVVRRRVAIAAGACGCWPNKWCNWNRKFDISDLASIVVERHTLTLFPQSKVLILD